MQPLSQQYKQIHSCAAKHPAHQNGVFTTPLHVSLPFVAADIHQRLDQAMISSVTRQVAQGEPEGIVPLLPVLILILQMLTCLLQSLQFLQSTPWLASVLCHWPQIYQTTIPWSKLYRVLNMMLPLNKVHAVTV